MLVQILLELARMAPDTMLPAIIEQGHVKSPSKATLLSVGTGGACTEIDVAGCMHCLPFFACCPQDLQKHASRSWKIQSESWKNRNMFSGDVMGV